MAAIPADALTAEPGLETGARRHARPAIPARLKIGVGLIAALVVIAAAGPAVFGFNPAEMHPSVVLQAPSLRFPFGTDDYGRDILARVVFGLRTSLEIAVIVSFLTGAIGLAISIGVVRIRLFNAVAMRLVDALMALPGIVMALALVTIIGPGFLEVVVVEFLFFVPWSIRVMRASMLGVGAMVYVEAAISQGASGFHLVARHILPNAAPPMLVQQVLIFGYAILAEAVLSFLGVGIEAPAASLGNILSEAQPVMLQDPLFSVFPGLLIAITVLAVNLIADGVAEHLNVDRRAVGEHVR